MNESDARFLEQLKKLYASAFDLTEEAASGEWMFRIYGHFNADHSGYVMRNPRNTCCRKKPSFGKQIVRNIFSFWRKQRKHRLIRRGFAVHPVGGGLWLVQSQAWPSAAEHDCRCRAADCLHRSRHILSDLFQQEPLAGRCVRVYFYRVRRSGLDSAAAKRLFEQLFALFHDCRGCHRRGVY